MTSTMTRDRLRAALDELMPGVRTDLERLVRIPGIAFDGFDHSHLGRGADTVAGLLRDAGLPDVRVVRVRDGHPAVIGRRPAPPGAPTVLLYAHHDVQPEGPIDQWDTPPFEPVLRDGRLFGRGAADDKSGIVAHAAAIRALLAEGELPATVKVLVEGEEECTAEHLPQLVEGNADLLRADVAVIADGGNYRTGVPTLNTSIRGVTDVVVQVRVLPTAQHSGAYGGPVPDAISALSRIIASLHDDAGDVTIPGLKRFAWEGAPIPEHEFRDESGVLDSIGLTGSGEIADRLFAGPAVAVLGIDAPAIAGSSNQIVPLARARVSLRVAPGDDPFAAREALIEHLRANAPWGVEVSFDLDTGGSTGHGHLLDTSTPGGRAALDALTRAYGREPIEMGSGGSIPLVPMLARTFPGIEILIWGAMDERSAIHSVNESVDLAEIERIALAEAVLVLNLGGVSR
jgi:acetylornithine deacetylase/succinyl-diaminopimelate desuccinylase-like protein